MTVSECGSGSVFIENDSTIAIRLSDGSRIYVSEHERGGFAILADRPFAIHPHADQSIRIVCELMDKDRKLKP